MHPTTDIRTSMPVVRHPTPMSVASGKMEA